MSTFHTLTIKEVSRETPHAISVVFDVPENLKKDYAFIAGQYLNLKFIIDGKEIRRAYSISSSPNNHELRVAIKAVKNGVVSSYANEKIKIGDKMEVGTPEGRFTFEPKADNQKNYAGFAAGSGITPVMSIIHSVLENEPKSTFVLTYGNKSPEETIFHKHLHELQQKHVGRFFVHYVFSQANAPEAHFGRIDKSVVNFILNNKHAEKTFDKFYLCGPEEMISLVSNVLKEHNISEKEIKYELFSTTPNETKAENTLGGHTKITVMVDDEEFEFEMAQKQTVLEAALKQGIDAPYSCQGGICSSCIARVTKGAAEMKKNSILTDKEIADGLILTCQAHPTSSEIYVDYDDV
ncbi:ferredoxin--NADP reductase [Flavobacterium sp. SM15]|uniref:ferredoxin--NADP reductase n=1 Tax=Flavobacterium sp. SM15 TaxID=2908005 RepID=UPI001EDA6B78|nr:ferredoxin--NADP reductase [Flavobacterium sp. SM15]MCG2610348.1 ferredoxin--NADP reductase [Flavobacterium sp. SM15]